MGVDSLRTWMGVAEISIGMEVLSDGWSPEELGSGMGFFDGAGFGFHIIFGWGWPGSESFV